MMNRHLAIITICTALTGCSTTKPPAIPKFPLKTKQMSADAYYKYATFWFKGNLKDGVPDGQGFCHTQYLYGSGNYYSKWIDSPCEFQTGERIDDLHKKRSENSLVFTNQIRAAQLQEEKEVAQEQAYAEAEERRERERSRAVFEQNMAVSLTSLNQQMMRDHQQMSDMVQKASTPPIRTYTPSISSSSSSSPSFDSSSTISGGNTNIDAINKNAKADKEKNLKDEERKKLEDKQAYEAKLAKEQNEREEEERQREIQLAHEKRDKEQQAEKERKEREQLVKKQQEEQEKNNYLTNVKNSLRLKAISCYGNNFAVGQIPKGLGFSKYVSGINIHYRAYCSGGGSYSGISKNFIGMIAGCLGDTNANDGGLIPKNLLSCNAEDMTIEVTNVTPTR